MLAKVFVAGFLLASGAAAGAAAPTAKQMLRALLANGDVPLSTHASCKDVSSEPSDTTLRDYISGLLANFAEPDAKNSISTSAKPVKTANGEIRWECRVQFVHVPGEDPFRYGVTFQMKGDGTLIRTSLRCTGSG